jgi:hypothetical protein
MKPFVPLVVILGLGLAGETGLARAAETCNEYAIKQSGFDPSRPPQQVQADTRVTGSGARARGAAGGAIIGGIAGDAGTGAAAGAVGGAVIHRSRARRAARSQNEGIAQQTAAGQAAYDQAYQACIARKNGK